MIGIVSYLLQASVCVESPALRVSGFVVDVVISLI